jgi:hypothetical protein
VRLTFRPWLAPAQHQGGVGRDGRVGGYRPGGRLITPTPPQWYRPRVQHLNAPEQLELSESLRAAGVDLGSRSRLRRLSDGPAVPTAPASSYESFWPVGLCWSSAGSDRRGSSPATAAAVHGALSLAPTGGRRRHSAMTSFSRTPAHFL